MRTKACAAEGLVASTADQVERPLEPRDLQEREVVGRIGVAPVQLLANDLLHSADAQGFRRGDGADRLAAHEAGEDSLRALARLGSGTDWLGGCGHGALFLLN